MGTAPRTRGEELRGQLADEIVQGRLAPGTPLEEMEIALRFNVSRTPVREALRELAASGLIELRAHQSALVALPSVERLRGMFDVLAELEALCAGLSAVHMSPRERAALETIHRDLGEAVRGGDPDAAEQSAANAAAHPLARLARGEIADARGRADVARTTFAELADDAAADPVGRVRAAAALAAGRLAQNAGQPDQAERRYRQALALRPGWPAAAERLGLLLAVSADDEERLEEAAALFPTGDGTDATVVLAQAVVGERLGRVDLVAERLDHLIRLPGFDRLPPDLRHGVAKWSAGVRLRRGDYRAAAAALERVWREEPTAAVEDQLVRCRLLQADGAVKQLPIPDGAIEEAAAAAEDVLARRPGDRLALLIATACGLLLKHENTRAAALGAVEWATDGERLAAAALRLLSGEGGATADIDRYAAAGPAGAARTLALLSASLAKNPEPFADAAAQLADAPDADGLPFEPEDVMLVGALDRVGRDQHDKAAKWLNRWHAAPGRGTAGSKQLHAFLLGREAGQILKTDLNGAADLLTRAIKLLPQAGRGT